MTSAAFEVLAWNDLTVALMEDFGALEPRDRNLARRAFLGPAWARQDVQAAPTLTKTFDHPVVGPITVDCDALALPDRDQHLVLYSAPVESPSAESLALLEVLGPERWQASSQDRR